MGKLKPKTEWSNLAMENLINLAEIEKAHKANPGVCSFEQQYDTNNHLLSEVTIKWEGGDIIVASDGFICQSDFIHGGRILSVWDIDWMVHDEENKQWYIKRR